MWGGDASLLPLEVLRRGEYGALELSGTDVRDERSSVIRTEENEERGGRGGVLGRSPLRSSNTMEDRPGMSL
jgi:hypothetical protein